MKNWLCVLAIALASNGGAAGAATFTFDVEIDLAADGRVYSATTNEWWEGWIDLTPTAVTSGDTLVFNIGFINNKGLMLSDLDGDNIELSKLTLGLSGSTFSEDIFFSSHEYTAYSGNLVNPNYSVTTGGAGGNRVPFFHRSNLTDSSFIYSGVSFTADLDVRDPVGSGTALLTQFEWSSSAQRVAIVDIPIVPVPPSFPLLLAGLFGLGWVAKRRRLS